MDGVPKLRDGIIMSSQMKLDCGKHSKVKTATALEEMKAPGCAPRCCCAVLVSMSY